jgi:hypothetical protein
MNDKTRTLRPAQTRHGNRFTCAHLNLLFSYFRPKPENKTKFERGQRDLAALRGLGRNLDVAHE